jgi:hypothetical protein
LASPPPGRSDHERRTAELLAELSGPAGRPTARPATTATPPATAPAATPATAPAATPAATPATRPAATDVAALIPAKPPREPLPAAASPAPAGGPARSASGYTVGDRWNYQVIDRQRGEVVRNYTLRVARLLPDGGWATPGNTLFDAQGRLVEAPLPNGGTHRYSPHALRWWPGMKAGDTRSFEIETARTRDDGTVQRQLVKADAQVAALETVRVPAGEFRAWRIEFRGNTRNIDGPGYGTFKHTVWYAPELRNHVAMENESRWEGQLSSLSREELTSLTVNLPGS